MPPKFFFFSSHHFFLALIPIFFCMAFFPLTKETWPLKKMYVSCTDPSCHNQFPDFLLVRQNSFATAYPMNYQNKLVWQLGSVHKINLHISLWKTILSKMLILCPPKVHKAAPGSPIFWNVKSFHCSILFILGKVNYFQNWLGKLQKNKILFLMAGP